VPISSSPRSETRLLWMEPLASSGATQAVDFLSCRRRSRRSIARGSSGRLLDREYRRFIPGTTSPGPGGLVSYGSNFPDLARRAGAYVDRILKGARAGDLPVQQPTKFELIVNMKTAKALAIEVPESVLLQADEIIE
jgi:hypothetical protein